MLRATFCQARRNFSHDSRVRALVRNIDACAGPAHVWDSYTDIISASGPSALPVDLHRHVLRCCSNDKDFHRDTLRTRIASGSFVDPVHVHEARFKVVLDNIAKLGQNPSVDDYDFVLDQMAAIGYFPGVLAMYEHMKAEGHQPTDDTFEACFRAIATRLLLPVPPHLRPDLVTYATARFQDLVKEHGRLDMEMTPSNMELVLRILKETLDKDSFLLLLRMSYAIDLANPDRIALEYGNDRKSAPLRFTTAALNTTLDMLGRMHDVPRLVTAFEVLTTPLPHAERAFFNTFADDHDDLGAGPAQRVRPPSAEPNATTYTVLLRHIAQAEHAVLARHYTLQAIRVARRSAWVTRHMIISRLAKNAPLDDVLAPRITIGRAVLLPVLGVANRHKNVTLLEWLHERMPGLRNRTKHDLEFYKGVMRHLRLPDLPEDYIPPFAQLLQEEEGASEEALEEDPPPKLLDLATHVYVLRRTLEELNALAPRVAYDLERTRQRVKERLGRRVWAAKDVYMRDENARVVVKKERWREVVAFRQVQPGMADMRPLWPQGPYIRRERRREEES